MRQLSLFLLLITTLTARAGWVSRDSVIAAGLPVVWIETEGGVMPTATTIYWSHNPTVPATVVANNKVPCRITVTLAHDTLFTSYPDSAAPRDYTHATIKVTGNSSAFFYNKPYKIKLAAKADMLCRGDSLYDDRDWKLLKDVLNLNQYLGTWICRRLQLPYTPAFQPCNVYINGAYHGAYAISETISRNKKSRINVDKHEGYIMERDPYWFKDSLYVRTNHCLRNQFLAYTYKYPKEDEVTPQQQHFIADRLQQMEDSIFADRYSAVIDVRSWAAFLLGHDILGTSDSYGSNHYLALHDELPATTFFVPTMWDFGTSLWLPYDSFTLQHNSLDYGYYPALLASADPSFRHTYKTLWQQQRATLIDDLTQWLDSLCASPQAAALDRSRHWHYQLWRVPSLTVREDADSLLRYLHRRVAWLDSAIALLPDGTAALPAIPYKPSATPSAKRLYTLGGRPATPSTKGLVITRGRKHAR